MTAPARQIPDKPLASNGKSAATPAAAGEEVSMDVHICPHSSISVGDRANAAAHTAPSGGGYGTDIERYRIFVKILRNDFC
jgi:hypothetical protein